MIGIGIAEDQALVRESLAIVLGLEPDVQVKWTADNGRLAVQLAQTQPADVILTDLRMPDLDGVQVIRQIRAGDDDCSFIVLTTFHQDEWLMDALRAGASACFLKEVPPKLLIQAIRDIQSGMWDVEQWTPEWRKYAPEIQFQSKLTNTQTLHDDVLTPREVELLRRMAIGETNAEIASSLHLSEGTVKNYVSTLYAKLGVRHRAEAIHLARQRGLV